jgi:hypothetical protein
MTTHGKYSVTEVGSAPRTVSHRPEHRFARGLPPGAKIEDRGDAGVFLIEGLEKWTGRDGKPLPRPDVTEQRIDAAEDAAFRRAGRDVWYDKFLTK